jgi:hypothetical protein
VKGAWKDNSCASLVGMTSSWRTAFRGWCVDSASADYEVRRPGGAWKGHLRFCIGLRLLRHFAPRNDVF